MNILIVKLGATGDVVRTTPLLRRLKGGITWVTAAKNAVLLANARENVRCLSWEERDRALDTRYDLVINLEDDLETASFARSTGHKQLFGAYADSGNTLKYTDDSKAWFDLSLISRYGRKEADRLKLKNRRTYQDMLFEGLGLQFTGETYVLPKPVDTGLSGDVAIAPEAGPVWPMKNWQCYGPLKSALEARGFTVNVLPIRSSLLEHAGDVANHRCLVSGDSLPMHFALGANVPCVTLFTCTSPWEIHDYGIQTKIISPLLSEFFYQRGFDSRATAAIGLDEVLASVMRKIQAPTASPA